MVVGVLVVEHPGDCEPEVGAEEVDEDGVAGVDGAKLLPADDLVAHEQHDLDQGHHDELKEKKKGESIEGEVTKIYLC